ncbi:MAG: efflux RND transporter periplasmic adaptor subunit [Bacteroidota bacterium]
MPFYLRLLIASAGACVVLLLWSGCGEAIADTPPVSPAIPVEIAAVEQAEGALPIRTSGRLAPKSERVLSFKVGGLVARINADEGDLVRAGQVLARIDPREIDAQVLQAESALDKAQRDLARAERLLADSVATLEQVQDARTGVEVAQAGYDIAAFNQRFATITAPASGRVLRRMAEPNELVQPGQPILALGTTGDGWVVRAGLADRDVVRLTVGDVAKVRFGAYPGEVFQGRVTEIASAADLATGTFEVEVAVPDPGGRLKAGFVADVEIQPSTGSGYAVIPIDALVAGDGTTGAVFTVDAAEMDSTGSHTVARRTVEITALSSDRLAVRAGLDGAAHVVTTGAAYLADGDRVRVADAP